MASIDNILTASQRHPKPADLVFQYGTAGFRMRANLLDSVVFRAALLASLRSRKLGGQTVGIMITASHNPPEDNGVKLIDPMGEMLENSWESYATDLANAASDQELVEIYQELQTDLKIIPSAPSRVIFARDTRPSGATLIKSLVDALAHTNTEYKDYGFLTTPQLHYLTRCINTEGTANAYGEASETGYYQKLADAFVQANRGRKFDGSVTVDCANGVGGPKLAAFLKYLPKPSEGGLEVKIINDNIIKPESLNHECGADYVKTKQRAPPGSKVASFDRCCSYDGDADRIVYYYNHADQGFRLLDGDRIAALAASFVVELVRQAGFGASLRIGVVQTAYANGASTKYIAKGLQLPIVVTPTGVKWLHHAATKFDIGVYFEANGHGTLVFSQNALKAFAKHEPQSPAQKAALETLRALTALINQTVGDALSDMLLVETILAYKAWTCREWDSMYDDLPNRLVRVEVKDRNMFITMDAERKLLEPYYVQEQIDAAVAKFQEGRSFARPSGTEDIIRVYAEAGTRSEADDLASKVAMIIKNAGS